MGRVVEVSTAWGPPVGWVDVGQLAGELCDDDVDEVFRREWLNGLAVEPARDGGGDGWDWSKRGLMHDEWWERGACQ